MLKISDAVAAPERFARVVWASASPRSPAIVAIAARHVLSLASSMFAPSEPSAKERASIAAFLRDLFVSLSVAPFASTKLAQPAPSPNAAPPNPRFVPVSGALTAFELRATRMFDRVAWQAPDACGAWHVILGDNASGKTSLLRAIALALLDRDEREAMRQDWSTWLRHDAPDGAVTVTLTDADSATHALSLELKRAARNGAGRHVDVRSSETLRYGGFLAAYGPFRRFTGGDPEWLKSFSAHPRTQRVVTLFEERAALSDALEWLKDLWVRAKTIKDAPEKSFLDRLLRFINGTGFLPPDVELLQPDADGVWCRDGAGRRVPVIDLSDGYRAALSLTLDLVRHLAMEHGHAKVFPRKAATAITLPGIVLIDEPDAHLHPTWQQRIGAWFKRTFPSMQFVVTTHSPIVCQAADSVLLLPAPGDDGPARMATPAELDRLRYGDVLDAFATEFFGRKVTRSEEGRKRLKQLAALNLKAVQQGLDDREREEQERLRGELGAAGEAPDAAS